MSFSRLLWISVSSGPWRRLSSNPLTPPVVLIPNPSPVTVTSLSNPRPCPVVASTPSPRHFYPNRSPHSNTIGKCTHKFPQKHTIVPPPQRLHVDPRPKPQKIANLNSSNQFLFVIQHKILKFPQNKILQLVTQFSVCLRVFPFSELDLQNSKTPNSFNPHSIDPVFSLFSWSSN
jgi:hypothetical protein